jgi:hypothetical protein
VVRPSLDGLEATLAELDDQNDAGSVFLREDLAEIFDATVQGFVLVVQSMFERGLRGLLKQRLGEPTGPVNSGVIERALWGTDAVRPPSLKSLFQEAVGVPLSAFDSYADLDLLQLLSNALRHGDGSSARSLFAAAPSLWSQWLEPGAVFYTTPDGTALRVPMSAPAHPPIAHLVLPRALLEQMIESVMWFWDDLETLRVQSLPPNTHGVTSFLGDAAAKRARRTNERAWAAPSERPQATDPMLGPPSHRPESVP